MVTMFSKVFRHLFLTYVSVENSFSIMGATVQDKVGDSVENLCRGCWKIYSNVNVCIFLNLLVIGFVSLDNVTQDFALPIMK